MGKTKKYTLNITGIGIVVLWIFLMGMQVKRVEFNRADGRSIDKNEPAAVESEQREWKEIYLKGKKVGYSVSIIRPVDKGYYINEEVLLKLNLMGMERGLYTTTYSNVDKDFLLKDFYFKMKSGVIDYEISGRVKNETLVIKTGRGKRQNTRTVKLIDPPMISAGIGHLFKTLRLEVGDIYTRPFFDPSTMAQKEVELKVAAKETIKINKIYYEAFRVETNMWGNLIKFWINEKGAVLKEEDGAMGLVMIRSSPANAPLNIETGKDQDFYEMSAIPVDRELPDPERLKYLKLKIEGDDDSVVFPVSMDGGRQRFEKGIMEVEIGDMPLEYPYMIPYGGMDDVLNSLLEPEYNIESDMEDIRKKAEQIAGRERDPLVVSEKLLNWVYKNIEKRPVLSVPSAIEVLATRMGDCNEHATLLTALLRASGIPARINIGLTYNRDRFFYHAWTEAYVGKWISMDATLNQMPVDVGHIRLTRGNLDQQVEIMGLIGKLSIEVLDYEYD